MEDRIHFPQKRSWRTWYGVTATVGLKSEFMHKSGFGIFAVPHPAAVNRLLRMGLPQPERIALALQHEFGHLQTLPLAMVFAGALLMVSTNLPPWIKLPAVLVSSQAAWEMMAEIFTRAADRGPFYKACYAGRNKLPRIIFWLLSVLMASSGAVIIASS